jgi:hypothetical protein
MKTSRIFYSTLVIFLAAAVLFFATHFSWLQRRTTESGIEIIGGDKFRSQIVAALILLKTKSPAAFQIVTNNIGVIEESEHSGMLADQTPPVFEFNDRSAFYSLTWCAGDIVHDSFHSKLYHDYQKSHSGTVPADVWMGHDAEVKCLKHQTQELKDIGAPDSEVTYCEHISPDYADVDYNKRNW